MNDSGIGTGCLGKENVPSHKRSRKALAQAWGVATSTPHGNVVPDVSFIMETPVSKIEFFGKIVLISQKFVLPYKT